MTESNKSHHLHNKDNGECELPESICTSKIDIQFLLTCFFRISTELRRKELIKSKRYSVSSNSVVGVGVIVDGMVDDEPFYDPSGGSIPDILSSVVVGCVAVAVPLVAPQAIVHAESRGGMVDGMVDGMVLEDEFSDGSAAVEDGMVKDIGSSDDSDGEDYVVGDVLVEDGGLCSLPISACGEETL